MNVEEKITLFWSRIDKSGGPESCWPWTRAVFKTTGYGQVANIWDVKHPTTAHRQAWILTHGDPGTYTNEKTGKVHTRRVLHRCPGGPNRLCCNPAHLAVGTDQDNCDDRAADGTQARGERMGSAKLTERQVCEARSRHRGGESLSSLARYYGVHVQTILPAVRGRTWTHLDCPPVPAPFAL